MRRDIGKYGFTLIELMLVVAIISVLSAIAIPKFGNMVRKAKEAAVYGKLGSLRSALSIYYADTEGTLPLWSQIAPVLTQGGKYLDEIPSIYIPGYNHVTLTTISGTEVAPHGDSGGWYYRQYTVAPYYKDGIYISCTHSDLKGQVWGPSESMPGP